MEYIRGSDAPECVFNKQHKTLNNLFSPDPAVSCVASKQVSNREIYTLRSILLHLAMDAFTWDKWILLAAILLGFIFQNYLGDIR